MRHVGLCLLVLVAYVAPARAQSKTFSVNVEFDTGTFSSCVDQPTNQVQLGGTPVSKNTIIWADNYIPGWVVKIDASSGRQLGRYDSGLVYYNNDVKQGATGSRPPREMCDFATIGNCPGRITTDTNADVWIINRAFGHQGTMSKYSGDLSHCIDRNNNGKIDTSVDANGDGRIDPDDPKEFFGQADECILTTIPVGANNHWPRGVAVDKNGKVWAGTFNGQQLFRYNPAEPVTLEATVSVASFGANPYSLATGGDWVYAAGAGGPMVRVNINTLQAESIASCKGCYGIVADPGGDVAWCGGWHNSATGVLKGDFKNKTCANWSANGQGVTAVTLDMQGNVWAAAFSIASVVKFNPAGQILGTFPSGGGSPHGLSVDFQGFIWSVNDGNSTVAKLKPDGTMVNTFSLAGPGNYNWTPYIYSDFTGVQVNRQAPYARFGNWIGTYDSGFAGVPWSKVTWNNEPEGAVPTSTTLKLFIRAADDMQTLATTGFTPLVNGAKLIGVTGRYVQIEADLQGPGWATPVLSDVSVVGPCTNGHGDGCCLAPADCDDMSPCTDDQCPAPGAACVHALRKGCCNVDADCTDANKCTTDKCSGPGGTCQFAPIMGCCNVDGDCGDGNLCTADKCSGPGGTCSNPPIANCCNAPADCDDKNLCTIDVCSGPGGACSHFAKGGCCNSNAECEDNNACTDDACTGPGGSCTHAAKVDCCNVDADCDDKNACTDDACSGPGGMCSHAARNGCCNVDADCDDKNACTADSCSGPGGVCSHGQITRCCNKDTECDDGDKCTTDVCSGPGGSCTHPRVADCCNADLDCDDSNVCTNDKCSGLGGACSHDPKGAGCCRIDTDCDDGNVCTTDSCSQGSACS